ncbi:MAG: hypothetical protein KF868_18465 [Acidobacteria bacterium]|nr:hypothetical protein [Acidobacteriota bacterium]MCW5967724.1 hypothetical protein [Blastocatellales bacterium]
MTITIEIPPDLDRKLRDEAERQGLSVDDYARRLLEERLSETEAPPFWATATPEEWLRAFDDWMDSHDATLPPLSAAAVSRESFYGERG